jgi:UDP-N-acetylmuramate dehydrogenase
LTLVAGESSMGRAEEFDRLARELGGVRHRALGELTTYRVGGAAAVFVHVESMGHLERVAAILAAVDVPVLVIGRGSNVLVADRGFAGVALQLGDFASQCDTPIVHDTGRSSTGQSFTVTVTVGGSALLPVVARRTVAAGLTGFEWAVGVPGTIGGGVRMNAGGHGSDMASSLLDVDLVDLRKGRRERRSAAEVGLRFRGSDLSDHDIVVSARLGLSPGDIDESQRVIDDIVAWRREHQPGGQNAGSVFVNPIPGELTAGELIDRAGLRGLRIGSAMVSMKHANFIQADVGGRADDVRAVIEHVRREIRDRFDIVLRTEIRQVGFDDAAHGGAT